MGKDKVFFPQRADKLYGWLAENHKTQTDIANLLGISVKTVNNKMLGYTDWKMSEVAKICKAWNISADFFY